MKQKREIAKYLVLFGAMFASFASSTVFAYEAAPLATTLSPTFVTEKSVQLNGRVNPNEMRDTYEWFEWGIVGRASIYETRHNNLGGRSTQINTRASIIGLAPSTQYFYRAIAENGRGKNIGVTTYFTTKPLPSPILPIAIVETKEVRLINDTSATLHGYVSPHGNIHTKTWFEWGTTRTMENKTGGQGSSGSSMAISARLTGLMPGSVYYFRAVAENEEGRSYGVLKVFSTTGFPVMVSTETPRDQYVSSPVDPTSDSVSRKVTTSGATIGGASTNGLPNISYRPGDFFSGFFGGRKNTPSTSVSAPNASDTTGDGGDQVASVASSGMFSNLINMFTGKKSVEVVVEKVGPRTITVHTPVEYRIAYAYRESTPASDAKLRITLPHDVIYIGDNTNNELLLENGSGPERTYVLPLGGIENGSTRAISILGMTTSDAKGFPDVRVRLEYTNGSGLHVVVASDGKLSNESDNSAAVGNVKNGILPNSLIGWIAYILVVVGAIIGIRKVKAYYVKRKESLAIKEEESGKTPEAPAFLPGAEVIPQ